MRVADTEAGHGVAYANTRDDDTAHDGHGDVNSDSAKPGGGEADEDVGSNPCAVGSEATGRGRGTPTGGAGCSMRLCDRDVQRGLRESGAVPERMLVWLGPVELKPKPTAKQDRRVAHEIPGSEKGAVRMIVQSRPFHVPTKRKLSPGPAPSSVSPTATHEVADRHDTAENSFVLRREVLGFGDARTVHVLPSHRSDRVWKRTLS